MPSLVDCHPRQENALNQILERWQGILAFTHEMILLLPQQIEVFIIPPVCPMNQNN